MLNSFVNSLRSRICHSSKSWSPFCIVRHYYAFNQAGYYIINPQARPPTLRVPAPKIVKSDKPSWRQPGHTCTVQTSIDDAGVATMNLSARPINGLNLELLTEINLKLNKLHSNPKCKALVLSVVCDDIPTEQCYQKVTELDYFHTYIPIPGMSNGILAADLDLLEFYNPDNKRLYEFFETLMDIWLQLYTSRLVTFAAFNGHSPFGGYWLGLACDYRIMAGDILGEEGADKYAFNIGQNEDKLGIVEDRGWPLWFSEEITTHFAGFLSRLGHTESERALYYCADVLFTVEMAHHNGLFDELLPRNEVLPATYQKCVEWLKVDDATRYQNKIRKRSPLSERFWRKQDEEVKYLIRFITDDKLQKDLDEYIETFKKKLKERSTTLKKRIEEHCAS